MAKRVLGVLAGQDMPSSLLLRWGASADFVLAADGGANRLTEGGFVPSIIVGDMDSASETALAGGAEVVRDEGQDLTDCDKLLALAKRIGHGALTLASIEGDLPDHELASLFSAARSGLEVRIAFRRGIGWILRGGDERRIDTLAGRRVSLLPFVPCTDVQLTGVKWPLDRAALSANGLISISNRAQDAQIVASMGQGSALLFVEFPDEEMPVW